MVCMGREWHLSKKTKNRKYPVDAVVDCLTLGEQGLDTSYVISQPNVMAFAVDQSKDITVICTGDSFCIVRIMRCHGKPTPTHWYCAHHARGHKCRDAVVGASAVGQQEMNPSYPLCRFPVRGRRMTTCVLRTRNVGRVVHESARCDTPQRPLSRSPQARNPCIQNHACLPRLEAF